MSQHLVGIEVFCRYLASTRSMFSIVGLDATQRLCRFVKGIERQQAIRSRDDAAEPGVLHDDRASSREITSRAATEPAAPRGDIYVFCRRKLTARASDEVPIPLGRERRLRAVHDTPAMLGEAFQRGIRAPNRHVERHLHAPRQD